MVKEGFFTIHVDEKLANQRLDVAVSTHLAECSRSFASTLIKKGAVKVNDGLVKPGHKVRSGDVIAGLVPAPEAFACSPEPVPFRVLFEDDHLMVVDKPPGLVVHPAPGHPSATLVHGLLFHCPDLKGVGGQMRPGIVHRLDKDTSGILLIAKNSSAHEKLSAQFKGRTIEKEYLALVSGRMTSESGRIALPIGRHPTDRKKMSVHSHSGRIAETLWKVREEFYRATLLQLDLKTGRTHQIRVHCAAIHHPVLGDVVYGKSGKTFRNEDGSVVKIPRQMLHAWRIRFAHPSDGSQMNFQAEIPDDMARLIRLFEKS